MASLDIWRCENGMIRENWVMVEFPYVMQQLGVDPFNGHGWEMLDSERMPLQNRD